MKFAFGSTMAILLLAPGLFAGAGGNPAEAAAKVHVLLGTLAPSGSTYHMALMEMGQKWREASGGAVTLTIYPDGTQGGEANMVRKMRVGGLTAGMLTVAGLAEIEPSVGGLSYLPLMFRSREEYEYVLTRLAPRLEKPMLEKGFVVLFWADAGWVYFFSKTPAVHPDDFKALKMWTLAGNTFQSDLMRKLGYNPAPSETTDTLTDLKTGRVSAFVQPPFFALASQCYREAPYMLDLKWSILAGGLVVRKRDWDRIPAGTQAKLREAAIEAGRKIREGSRTEEEKSIAAMRKRGLNVEAVTPEIEKEWRQLTNRIYPEIRGNMVPEEIFDEVERLVGEYRSSHKGPGR